MLNERIARYQCRRHPDELTYEQRMEFNRNSVVKKALLESLRLTGKEEDGDWEAEVTVRVTDNAAGDTVMNRTLLAYCFAWPGCLRPFTSAKPSRVDKPVCCFHPSCLFRLPICL